MKHIKPINWIFFGITFLILLLLWTSKIQTAHASCPFSIVCFGTFSIKYRLILFPISMALGGLILLSTFFWGRFFCGKICPLGTLQDIISGFRKEKRNTQKSLQRHNKFLFLKYIILLLVFVLSYFSLHGIYLVFCPIYVISHPLFFHFFTILTLLTIFVLPLFITRFWCNYLCPFAALMNITQYIGAILHIPRKKIVRNDSTCINCKLCDCFCKMNIHISDKITIEDVNCIHCEKCIEKCVKDDCLSFDKCLKRGKNA